jgi:hypothetical protein
MRNLVRLDEIQVYRDPRTNSMIIRQSSNPPARRNNRHPARQQPRNHRPEGLQSRWVFIGVIGFFAYIIGGVPCMIGTGFFVGGGLYLTQLIVRTFRLR